MAARAPIFVTIGPPIKADSVHFLGHLAHHGANRVSQSPVLARAHRNAPLNLVPSRLMSAARRCYR